MLPTELKKKNNYTNKGAVKLERESHRIIERLRVFYAQEGHIGFLSKAKVVTLALQDALEKRLPPEE